MLILQVLVVFVVMVHQKRRERFLISQQESKLNKEFQVNQVLELDHEEREHHGASNGLRRETLILINQIIIALITFRIMFLPRVKYPAAVKLGHWCLI